MTELILYRQSSSEIEDSLPVNGKEEIVFTMPEYDLFIQVFMEIDEEKAEESEAEESRSIEESIAEESRRVNRPFWAFALATAHGPYPPPTMASLRLQMYSNLAYGAQLLQYFTYWTPGTENWDFHQAPITQDGRRSPVYDLVRQMNQEIQQRAFVWAGCRVESVFHLGDSLPAGTKPLTTLPSHFLSIKNDEAGGSGLVSQILNNGHRYVMLVNTSPMKPWYVCVETDESVLLIRRDGSSQPASLYTPVHILSPGNCEIFEVR